MKWKTAWPDEAIHVQILWPMWACPVLRLKCCLLMWPLIFCYTPSIESGEVMEVDLLHPHRKWVVMSLCAILLAAKFHGVFWSLPSGPASRILPRPCSGRDWMRVVDYHGCKVICAHLKQWVREEMDSWILLTGLVSLTGGLRVPHSRDFLHNFCLQCRTTPHKTISLTSILQKGCITAKSSEPGGSAPPPQVIQEGPLIRLCVQHNAGKVLSSPKHTCSSLVCFKYSDSKELILETTEQLAS